MKDAPLDPDPAQHPVDKQLQPFRVQVPQPADLVLQGRQKARNQAIHPFRVRLGDGSPAFFQGASDPAAQPEFGVDFPADSLFHLLAQGRSPPAGFRAEPVARSGANQVMLGAMKVAMKAGSSSRPPPVPVECSGQLLERQPASFGGDELLQGLSGN